MTKEQVIKKLIEKAINSGWQVGDIIKEDLGDRFEESLPQVFHQWEWLPFDHDFAKALWGTKRARSQHIIPAWWYHLQQLAISEDRFKYLEQFV